MSPSMIQAKRQAIGNTIEVIQGLMDSCEDERKVEAYQRKIEELQEVDKDLTYEAHYQC